VKKIKSRTATALLSGGSQGITQFDLWEFYGNSKTMLIDCFNARLTGNTNAVIRCIWNQKRRNDITIENV
jgi:hypothetical protein